MKNFLKTLIVFVAIIFGGMQAEGQSYQIAFLSDTGWVKDYAPNSALPSMIINYRYPSITGVGGDTLRFKLVSDTGDVDVAYWEVRATQPVDSLLEYLDDDFIILPDSITKAFKIVPFAIDSSIYTIGVNGGTIFTKFNNPNVTFINPGGGNKASIQGTDTIYLEDFGLKFDTLGLYGQAKTYCDSIAWYSVEKGFVVGGDGSLDSLVVDSSMVDSSGFGEFTVEIFIARELYSPTDTNVFVIRYWSDTAISIQLFVDSTHVSIEYFSNENSFNVYPNPAVEYLYFSDEVEYVVYSFSGQEMIRGKGKEVDVREFESGVYVLSTPLGNRKFRVE